MCQPGMKHSGATAVVDRPKRAAQPVIESAPTGQNDPYFASLPRIEEATSASRPAARNATSSTASQNDTRSPAKPDQRRGDGPRNVGSGASDSGKNTSSPTPAQPQPPVSRAVQVPVIPPAQSKAHATPPRSEPVRPAAEPVRKVLPPLTRDQALQPRDDRKIRMITSPGKPKSPAVTNESAPETVPAEFIGKSKDAIRVVLAEAVRSESRPGNEHRQKSDQEAALRRLYKLAWNVEPRASEMESQNRSDLKARILRGIQMHFGEEFPSLKLPKFLAPQK